MSLPISPEQQGLKRACAALVRTAGGLEEAALHCRVGKTQLGDAGSINRPDKWLSVDAVRDLEAVTHGQPAHPAVTRYLARAAGFALVPLPDVDGGAHIGPLQLAGLAREANDAVTKLAVAIATDGAVCAAEVLELGLVSQLDDLADHVAMLRAACKSLVSATGRGARS